MPCPISPPRLCSWESSAVAIGSIWLANRFGWTRPKRTRRWKNGRIGNFEWSGELPHSLLISVCWRNIGAKGAACAIAHGDIRIRLEANDCLAAEAAVAKGFKQLRRSVQFDSGPDARRDLAVGKHARHLAQPLGR
jgi:hypothetical protein